MSQFNPFACSSEQNRMLTHNISATNRMHSNLVLRPLTDKTSPSMANALIVFEPARVRDNFSQSLRCSARRILFQPMMELNNFDVKIRTRYPVGLFGEQE